MKNLTQCISNKSEMTVAGEMLMEVREKLQQEDLTIEQHLEYLKEGVSILDRRMKARAAKKNKATLEMSLHEFNLKFGTLIKIENIDISTEE